METTADFNDIGQSEGFRRLVQKEFLNRCKKNPSYSMRAYAQSLNVDQAQLSRLLRKKRRFTSEMIQRIGQSLELSPKQIKGFIEPTKSSLLEQLEEDYFDVVSDWYHFAIVELIKTSDFKASEQWIADRLSISTTAVRSALEKLERLGFVSIKEGSIQLEKPDNDWTNFESSSIARRKWMKQLLLKAVDAVDEQSFQHRDMVGLTLACDPERIDEIKKRIHACWTELDQYVVNHHEPKEVYQLAIAFFALTKEFKK